MFTLLLMIYLYQAGKSGQIFRETEILAEKTFSIPSEHVHI